jgi:hypothetical protein
MAQDLVPGAPTPNSQEAPRRGPWFCLIGCWVWIEGFIGTKVTNRLQITYGPSAAVPEAIRISGATALLLQYFIDADIGVAVFELATTKSAALLLGTGECASQGKY